MQRRRLGRGENFSLELAASARMKPGLELLILNQLAQIPRRSLIFGAPSKRTIHSQSVARAGHSNVEQASLFLLVNGFIVLRHSSIAQLGGNLDQRTAV